MACDVLKNTGQGWQPRQSRLGFLQWDQTSLHFMYVVVSLYHSLAYIYYCYNKMSSFAFRLFRCLRWMSFPPCALTSQVETLKL